MVAGAHNSGTCYECTIAMIISYIYPQKEGSRCLGQSVDIHNCTSRHADSNNILKYKGLYLTDAHLSTEQYRELVIFGQVLYVTFAKPCTIIAAIC